MHKSTTCYSFGSLCFDSYTVILSQPIGKEHSEFN